MERQKSTPTPDHADLMLIEALQDIRNAAENKEGDPGQDVIDIVDGIAKRALEKHAAAVKRGEA